MKETLRETRAAYSIDPNDDQVVQHALAILSRRLTQGPVMNSPGIVKAYLSVRLAGLEREVFGAIFLDSQQRVIMYEELFVGTLTQTSVYPREVVKRALQLNAAAVILAHNHPSGTTEPSRADELITQTLKSSLQLVDVRVLDHFVVGHGAAVSMAERGLT